MWLSRRCQTSCQKSLGEDDIRLICQSVAQDSGPAGAEHARKWIERDTAKNVMELAGYRQQLRRQELDTGKERGMSLGMYGNDSETDLLIFNFG
ncbi:hypothetical protein SAMN05216327_10210 [Dyadobacter sp. SG02]|uniref:hypothetical protein n=1 Tax=Dyadobacter sp. SG02 TaxID=1855291 RepID=UPI0008C06D9D|nr:hypothetical protein [Dyadobacter sp. SG02]SEI49254.1 hypothetical protein SAMN05216327_10210 [Dyadobacter sp. SG02]